jgi:hypothetical protein
MHPFDEAHELSLTDLLNRLRGKKATIFFGDNNTATGKIKDDVDYTSAHCKLVLIEKLEGKEYFDLIVPKEKISAIMLRRPDSP